MQQDLEAVRKTKVTLQGTTLTWTDMVALARDKLTQTPLVPPTAPTTQAPKTTRPTTTETTPQTTGGTGGRVCEYCAPLGQGMDNHDAKWCFINPASSQYKPDVRARRI
jgi:hypothetical protein